MKYSINYNRARNIWMVWRLGTYGGEVVKTFKTEQGAIKWVSKQG